MGDIEKAHVASAQVCRGHFRNQSWFPWSLEDFAECPECNGEDDEWSAGGECSEREAGRHQEFTADQHSPARETAEQVCGGQLQQHNQSAVQADHLSEFQLIKSHSIEVERESDEGLHEDDVCQQAAGHEQQKVVVVLQVLQCRQSRAWSGSLADGCGAADGGISRCHGCIAGMSSLLAVGGMAVDAVKFANCKPYDNAVQSGGSGIGVEEVLKGFAGEVTAEWWSDGEAQIEGEVEQAIGVWTLGFGDSITDEGSGGWSVHIHDQGEQKQNEHEQPAVTDLAQQQQRSGSAEKCEEHCAASAEVVCQLAADEGRDDGAAAESADAVAGKVCSEFEFFADVD